MEIWELICREQVRDVVSRYASCVDSGRIDEVMPLFAPDAIFSVNEQTYHGHTEIRGIFTGAAATLVERTGPRPLIRHMITTHEITPRDEAFARSRCYFLALVGTRALTHWGRYIDDFAQLDGNWKIVNRQVIIDGTVEEGWTG